MSKKMDWGELPWRYDEMGHWVVDKNGNRIFDMRGWGHLTGGGGLNLSYEEAAKLQDDLAKKIIETMNKEGGK